MPTDRGIELGLAGAGESDLARARYYVYASVRLWQAFLDEFGDDSRLINVLGSVNDEDVFWDGAMQMAALDNPAINPRGLRPDRFSIATYVGMAHDGASSTLFDSELPADLAVLLQGYRVARSGLDAAGYSDVAINSYEGGTHILRNADVGNRNPGIYDFYREMLDALEAEGFASFQHYVATSEHYEGQGFGFNEYTGQPGGDGAEVARAQGLDRGTLADERIPNCQFCEAREVSVGGPELPHTVIETQRGDSRVVDLGARDFRRLEHLGESIRVPQPFGEKRQRRRLEPSRDLVERLG